MKIDKYKIESSLSELQEKLGDLTHQTKDVLQGLQERSTVTIEQTKIVTRSVYNGTIQPGMQDFYRKAEQSATEICCKATKFSKENHYFKIFKEKVNSIMNSK